ncbi:hypothetical protein ZEAMMB73_Zm00001d004394 [Zea mays]|uniref:Uncharacterized protein n=1 Tax=Zea mays TaxID=4577 RepID=A0A1D6EF27_MAIZE|nr:hypothetical protein ZEAMMB73_Zm00001d004394 [Zea mays]
MGLDFVLSEARKHEIKMILSLVNNYDSFGGRKQYWHEHDNVNDFEQSHLKAPEFELAVESLPYAHVIEVRLEEKTKAPADTEAAPEDINDIIELPNVPTKVPERPKAPEKNKGHFVILQAAVRNNGGLVKEAKAIIRLFPIWVACLLYAAATLDRRIERHFQVPPAALHSFISITIVVIIPIYDRVLVPVSRRYSGKPSWITMLQRIGTGMFLSLLSMVIAALVENRSCDLEAATWRLYPSYGRAIRCYLVDLRSI